jgi:hypothetical protein
VYFYALWIEYFSTHMMTPHPPSCIHLLILHQYIPSFLSQFPPPFSMSLGFMSILSFDFLALECMSQNITTMETYFVSTYLTCVIPIFLMIVVVISGAVRVATMSIGSGGAESSLATTQRQKRTSVVNLHFWLLLFLSYIVLPPVANKQLKSLDCVTFKSGLSYLRDDTSISCDTSDYKAFASIIYVFIVLYQLIPITWMILLYRRRGELNPPAAKNDETLGEFIRNQNPQLSNLKFLFSDYNCKSWWFEILDMYRRILFIGILPLTSRQSSVRASFGCILAVMSAAYFREKKPYRVEYTNTIAYVAQVFANNSIDKLQSFVH